VYETTNSQLRSSLGGSLHSHGALLSKQTFPAASPLADELLQSPPSQTPQLPPQIQSQQTQLLSPRSQRSSPTTTHQQQSDILQQLHTQQKQEQSEKQKLLQQQIQRHQLQQQLRQQQQQSVQQQQALVQNQQSVQVVDHQVAQQVLQTTQSLVQSAQDLLQTPGTELTTSHTLQGPVLSGEEISQHQQLQYASPAGGSPQAQPPVVGTESSGQMGGVGGGTMQVTHPLNHVMNSDATAVVQNMSYMEQNYDHVASSSGMVYATDGYQDSSSSSQVFTSPVYNTQSVAQVYQIPPQPQSSLSQEGFTEPFTSSTDSVSYASTLTNLPLAQHHHNQGGQQGQSLDTSSFHPPPPSQQPQSVMNQQGGGGTGGGGVMTSMNQMSVQSQDANILHMQAQIAQSAFELQSVQMEQSMQGYDATSMIQTSADYRDGSTGGYQEMTNTYQEDTNAYQEGTSAYQTATNAYHIQNSGGYQDAGVSYSDHSQATHGQTVSSVTGTASFANANSLELEPSGQMYSTTVALQNHGLQQEHQQMSYSGPVTTDVSSSEVVAYNTQMDSVYTALSADMFQQATIPVSTVGGGGVPQALANDNTSLLAVQQTPPDVLNPVQQIETSQEDALPTSSSNPTSETNSTANTAPENSARKSQKPKESVGIQCEVGPETFRALKEEEAQAKLITGSSTSTSGDSANSREAVEYSSSLVAASSSSLLLNNAGSPPLHDPLNAASPGVNTSGSEVNSQSDKVIRKYPCELPTCGKAYVHRKDLIRHMTLRHGMSPQKLEPVVIETPEKPYTCQVGVCHKSYFHQKDLRRHQRQCHSVSDNGNLSGAVEMTDADGKVMVRFPCDFPGCQRSYVHKKDLVRHKRVYHKDESKKPSIPIPVKFTEADLKRIRHEEKTFTDKDAPAKKPRLDSTGSVMSSGEDQSQGSEPVQISESMGAAVRLSSASPGTPGEGLDQAGVGGEVAPSLQSAEFPSISEDDANGFSNTVQLALGLTQQQQQVVVGGSSQLAVSLHTVGQQQASPTQSGNHHLPTILRRQRHSGSNGQQTATAVTQEQQLTNEIALRNLASLMLGGLQGVATNSSGTSFDTNVSAFSASPLTATGDPVTSQAGVGDPQQAVAGFDPAAIISALSSVVNNPDLLGTASSPSLEQHQVVSMENVASALQYLTSTSNST
jgi:hypothetical protein